MEIDEIKALIEAAESHDHIILSIDLLKIYLALNPVSSRFSLMLGENLRVVGRLTEAQTILQSIDQQAVPENHRYLICLNLGQIYEALGKWDLAEQQYRKSVDLRSDSTVPWVYLGAFFSRQGRFDDAVTTLSKGLAAEGDLDEVHINLGNCFRALDDLEKARVHYEAALSLDPNYMEARLALDDIVAAISLQKRLAAEVPP